MHDRIERQDGNVTYVNFFDKATVRYWVLNNTPDAFKLPFFDIPFGPDFLDPIPYSPPDITDPEDWEDTF